MTPVQRVQRARTVLATTAVLAAALWGAAAGMAALALAAAAGALGLFSVSAAWLVGPMAVAAALGAIAAVLWRERAVWSLELVALWLEEHAPQLKYALVTLVDPRYDEPSVKAESYTALVQAAGQAELETIVRRSASRTLLWAAGAFAAAGVVLLLLWSYAPVPAYAKPTRHGAAPKPLANRLAKLRAELVPPAYSGLPRRVITEPTNVPGLAGTQVRFLGEGPSEGVTAVFVNDTVRKDTLRARPVDDGWAVPVAMSKQPGVLQFRDRTYRRSVVLEPLPDSAPQLLLRLPAKDTTYRYVPKGQLALEAEIQDDYGIDAAFFEILVSTGSAENYDTKDRSTARVPFGGQRRGTLRTTLSFAALEVGPGTVLHIRAVAFDRNNVDSVPGRGVSDTRTLRVALPKEYDTVYLNPAPPLPIDTLYVSQRLLNARTDTLIRFRQRNITSDQYVDTSVHYSGKQEEIRQRVNKVIEIAEDDGVGGRQQTPVGLLLREAAEQMWTAFGLLAIGQPDSALTPYMKEALRLLELARRAKKFLPRGVLAARPVDINNARLKGTETPEATDRTARPIPEDLRRALRERLVVVVPLAIASPQGSLDSLMLLRVSALTAAPTVAAALQEAIDAAQKGKSTAAALARAQRLLDPPSRVIIGPTEWGGGMLP